MVTVENPPPDDVVVTVGEHLDPHAFGDIVRTAYEHVETPGPAGIRVACDLYRLVREHVDKQTYSNFRHPPREALQVGANCVDTTTLYCSMLIRADFTCRVVLLRNGARGHMYPEIYAAATSDEIVAAVSQYYRDWGRRRLRQLVSFDSEDGGGQWLVADPATTNCLGSGRGLERLGYLALNGQTATFDCDVERFELMYHRGGE